MKLNKIESISESLLKELNISQPPIPIEKIAVHLGIKVARDSFEDDLSGFLYRNKEEQEYIIGINKEHPEVRQRFTIAHEIGHFLLHEGENTHIDNFRVNFRNTLSSLAVRKEEVEANTFAAALLMPEKMISQAILKLDENVDFYDNESKEVEALAKEFNVSKQALYIRLGKLGIL